MQSYYVYILCNKQHETLYIGSTTNLAKRIWEHKNKIIPGFTEKYNVTRLVYYEIHQSYIQAAQRERRLKNWYRQWKLDLIEKFNPGWRDLHNDTFFQ